MMNLFSNIEEEIETFSVSPEITVTVERFDGDGKIAIIDNFWKNPDKIREVTLSIPKTWNPRIIHGLPGARIEATFYFSHLGELFRDLIKNIYPEEFKMLKTDDYVQACFDNASFLVNVQNSNLPPRVPHIDNLGEPYRWAAGIYLNRPDECTGGTAFYTFRGSKTVNMMTIESLVKDYPIYVQDDYRDFKKIHMAEMKYNRLVLYPQNLLHTPYIPPNTFTDENPRLMQMFFI
jgi:hypothetical protein